MSREHLARLRFPAEMEARFVALSAEPRLKHFVISGAIALLVYNGFLMADWFLMPDTFMLDVSLRIVVTMTYCAGVLWLLHVRRAFCLRQPVWFAEGLIVGTGVLAAATLAVVLVQSNSPIRMLAHGGFMPMIVYGNVVQRLRFRSALVLSACVMAMHLLVIANTNASPPMLMWPIILMNVVTVLLTLVSNYEMEYEQRERFLLRSSELVLIEKLNASHEQLEALARCDALTGLANRRHVDAYLQAHLDVAPPLIWSDQASLALLILDVDHFKGYNDRYGHPAGDECLRQVAQAVQRLVPIERGLVARWGGEEFLVALPHASAQEALHLGQAIQIAVQALGLPHEASAVAGCVTVSVGVCVGAHVPRVSGQSNMAWADGLLVRADEALYGAKHQGRNRVVMAGA